MDTVSLAIVIMVGATRNFIFYGAGDAGDLAVSVIENPEVPNLSKCETVVIHIHGSNSFDPVAAVIIHENVPDSSDPSQRIVFDSGS